MPDFYAGNEQEDFRMFEPAGITVKPLPEIFGTGKRKI